MSDTSWRTTAAVRKTGVRVGLAHAHESIVKVGIKLQIVDTVYKGHDIHASAWELLEPIGWEPHLNVSWWEAGQRITKSFTLNQIFSTRQEAGRAGLSFAQKWIDDGKPDRSWQT